MNIEKRIKRHILGKAHSFYIAVTPGLEGVCRNEMSMLGFDMVSVTTTKGGIEFQDRMPACYTANLRLRTANRVLMRIGSIKATNFRQLEAKAAEIPWELYLQPGRPLDVDVSSHHSRLFHTTAIAGRIQQVAGHRLEQVLSSPEGTEERSDFPQRIFVRAADDAMVVSLDSSGDLLHKRGLKKNVGRAPMRETLAAAILIAAGYRPDEPLIDPMCGSGTFSMEAAMMACRIPPGWYRRFAFMDWPSFKDARWQHLRREAGRERIHVERPVIFASDKDLQTCEAFEEAIRETEFSGAIAVANADVLDIEPVRDKDGRPGLIVINPPYGHRMETKEDSSRLFLEICRKLKKDFKGWKLALIAWDRRLADRVPFPVNIDEILHGGLHLLLLTGRIA